MNRVLTVNNNGYNLTETGTEEEQIPVSPRNRAPHYAPPARNRAPAGSKKSGKNYLMMALFALAIAVICAAFLILGIFIGRRLALNSLSPSVNTAEDEVDDDPGWNAPDYVDYQPIVKNEYSRPDIKLEEINAVVVHYVADPTATAAQTRAYFNNLAITHYTWASSHFVVGLDGEVLQLIPLTEWAYCSNERNKDTVSIECCHPEEDGKFTDETYASLVKLVADLCREYDLDPKTDVIRHYDVTGKLCPLYFVEHEDAWHDFLDDVAEEFAASK